VHCCVSYAATNISMVSRKILQHSTPILCSFPQLPGAYSRQSPLKNIDTEHHLPDIKKGWLVHLAHKLHSAFAYVCWDGHRRVADSTAANVAPLACCSTCVYVLLVFMSSACPRSSLWVFLLLDMLFLNCIFHLLLCVLWGCVLARTTPLTLQVKKQYLTPARLS